MKKNVTLILLLILALCFTMLMTGCGGSGSGEPAETPEETAEEATEATDEAAEATEEAEETTPAAAMTVEEFVNQNPDVKKAMVDSAAERDTSLEFSGNQVLYIIPLENFEGYTDENVASGAAHDALEEALEQQKATFGEQTKSLEEAFGITGIESVLVYTWGGETVISKAFTAADAE